MIDSHMHIPQWLRNDGKSAFEVIEDYRRENNIMFVDNMCCTSNGNLWGGFEADQSILGAIAKLENPNVFVHGCLYIPNDAVESKKYSFTDQLDELMELGMDGIKICDFKPDAYKRLNVEQNLEEYEKYISCCEKYNVHMCWHIADPDFFWDGSAVPEEIKRANWFYGDGTYPSYEKLIAYACEMLDKHPKLRVQLAHAFFKSNEPSEIEAILEKYPNVTIDLAPGGEMFDGFRTHYDSWFKIFRRYSDRFLYATDASTTYSTEGMTGIAQKVLRFLSTDDIFAYSDKNTAHGIKLEREHLDNILYKNHERTVGRSPRQINRSALKKYIDRYLKLMPPSENSRMIEEYYRKDLL